MGITYIGKNGKEINANADMVDWLTKLTRLLFNKFGIPRPCSKKDCKIIARMIRNYITLMQWYDESNWEKVGMSNETMDETDKETLLEFAEFFDTCRGLK